MSRKTIFQFTPQSLANRLYAIDFCSSVSCDMTKATLHTCIQIDKMPLWYEIYCAFKINCDWRFREIDIGWRADGINWIHSFLSCTADRLVDYICATAGKNKETYSLMALHIRWNTVNRYFLSAIIHFFCSPRCVRPQFICLRQLSSFDDFHHRNLSRCLCVDFYLRRCFANNNSFMP